MALEIVQAGDPVLREPAAPIDTSHIGTREFNKLIAEMVETMRAAPGVGLAAPQIGLGIQLVVLEDSPRNIEMLDEEDRNERMRDAVPLTVLINPTLEPVGDEKVVFYEGCLSVSGWAAETPRYRRVKVRAINEKGEQVELDWQGWPARILQHEYDHLQGVLYVDHMDTRTFSTVQNLSGDDED